MNSRLKDILDSYEDFELAFLSKYKLHTYMDGTKKSIEKYIADHGLTESGIDQLIDQVQSVSFEDDHERCSRCKSRKIRSEKVEWHDTAFKAGYSDEIATLDGLSGKATFKDQVVCDVCGLWIEDPNNQNPDSRTFWQRIKNIIFD